MTPSPVRVTTSRHAGPHEVARADALADRWGWPRVAAGTPDDPPLLVVTRAGLVLRWAGRDRRWHDGMLHARQAAGAHHPLVRLSDLGPGDTVVDCTLGLGADARFLAAWTGTRVCAFEASPVLGEMAREGLARVGAPVDVQITEAVVGLAALPDDSVDVVVADPMFPTGHAGDGPSLEGVRWVATGAPLDAAWRDQALRVARRAVVVRAAHGDGWLEALGAPVVVGRRDRAARYGAWRLDDATPR